MRTNKYNNYINRLDICMKTNYNLPIKHITSKNTVIAACALPY